MRVDDNPFQMAAKYPIVQDYSRKDFKVDDGGQWFEISLTKLLRSLSNLSKF